MKKQLQLSSNRQYNDTAEAVCKHKLNNDKHDDFYKWSFEMYNQSFNDSRYLKQSQNFLHW